MASLIVCEDVDWRELIEMATSSLLCVKMVWLLKFMTSSQTNLPYEGKYKRLVEYNGSIDPSSVHPLWKSWLRNTVEKPPSIEVCNLL